MSQPYQDPPKKLYRVVSRFIGASGGVYTSYRYYWDEKGAKRHGLSRYINDNREQWIEEATIGSFTRVESEEE